VTVAGLETIQPAGNLKPVTLELCGKGSRVILDDADLVIDGSLYDSLISGSGSLVPADWATPGFALILSPPA
jgi:hypothetical protein